MKRDKSLGKEKKPRERGGRGRKKSETETNIQKENLLIRGSSPTGLDLTDQVS